MINLTAEQFTTRDVTKAVGIDNATLQSWLYRGYIPIPNADAVGSGNRRAFPAWTIVMLGLTRELAKSYGISPVEASSAAWHIGRKVASSGIEPESFMENPSPQYMRTLFFCDGKYSASVKGGSLEPGRRSGLVLGVGTITIEVLERLEQILREREGQP